MTPPRIGDTLFAREPELGAPDGRNARLERSFRGKPALSAGYGKVIASEMDAGVKGRLIFL
jgi:hypothetical protein